jgi:trimethylamine:corrinoid methyltransferase-like protein
MFKEFDFKAEFLQQKITRRLFAKEQYMPSSVIDRGSIRAWQEEGSLDTFSRAKMRVVQLLESYQRPAISFEQERELRRMVERVAREAGMEKLPVEKM